MRDAEFDHGPDRPDQRFVDVLPAEPGPAGGGRRVDHAIADHAEPARANGIHRSRRVFGQDEFSHHAEGLAVGGDGLSRSELVRLLRRRLVGVDEFREDQPRASGSLGHGVDAGRDGGGVAGPVPTVVEGRDNLGVLASGRRAAPLPEVVIASLHADSCLIRVTVVDELRDADSHGAALSEGTITLILRPARHAFACGRHSWCRQTCFAE